MHEQKENIRARPNPLENINYLKEDKKEEIREYEQKRIESLENFLLNEFLKDLEEKQAKTQGNSHTEVAVIGLGPTGLIAALDAYKRGYNVTAYEKRKSYTREQAFRFKVADLDQILEKYISHKKIQELINKKVLYKRKSPIEQGVLFGGNNSVEEEHYEIAVKHLEMILFRILKKTTDVEIKQNEFIRFRNGLVVLKDDQDFEYEQAFDYVFACDGLNSNVRKKAGIEVQTYGEKRKYRAVILYQDSKVNNGEIIQPKQIEESSHLNKQGPGQGINISQALGGLPLTDHKQIELYKKDAFHRIPATRIFFTAIGTYIGLELSRQDRSNEEDVENHMLELLFRSYGI